MVMVPMIEPATGKRPSLTRPQLEVFTFLVESWIRNQRYPSIREVMTHTRIKNPNGIVCHLGAMVKKGYIRRLANKTARGIEVVGLGEAVRAAAQTHLRNLLQEARP